jgi:hypothetical protein
VAEVLLLVEVVVVVVVVLLLLLPSSPKCGLRVSLTRSPPPDALLLHPP